MTHREQPFVDAGSRVSLGWSLSAPTAMLERVGTSHESGVAARERCLVGAESGEVERPSRPAHPWPAQRLGGRHREGGVMGRCHWGRRGGAD